MKTRGQIWGDLILFIGRPKTAIPVSFLAFVAAWIFRSDDLLYTIVIPVGACFLFWLFAWSYAALGVLIHAFCDPAFRDELRNIVRGSKRS